MKILLTLIAFILTTLSAGAQSLSLFDVDTTNFPTMKAKFYAFDAAGNQVRPSLGELTLTENGIDRTITNIYCPPPKPPVAISSVLTVDMSGSMRDGQGATPNIELAKAAARAWIQGLPAGQSECALTNFNNSNYLNQDFTIDRTRLLSALSTLTPNGGTNYDMGLLRPLAGSLEVSKRGQYKRVVVFLSDGIPNSEPSTAAIIAEAKRQNCMVFAVTLGMSCPKSLKDITSQTGGQWYENVTTTPEAEEVYRKIIQVALSNTPCEITWQSEMACRAGITNLELLWKGQRSVTSYSIPTSGIAGLFFTPASVFCKSKPVGVRFDTTVTVTANNKAFNIINIVSNNPIFDVNPKVFPLNIGQSQVLTISYTPADSGYAWTELDLQTDICPQTFSASGGFLRKKPTKATLKLTHPNGSEVFIAGSDTVITWEGIPATDTVSLELSINNGRRWQNLTPKTNGLTYLWKNVPGPSSDQCLVRVKHYNAEVDTRSDSVQTIMANQGKVRCIAWSHDGTKLVTGGYDNTTKIWDAITGKAIITHYEHTGSVLSVGWSPDDTKVATASVDKTVKIWNVMTGQVIQTLTGHSDVVKAVSWAPDNSRIATASSDKTSKIWDANSGLLLLTLTGHKGAVNCISWNPDGNLVATGSEDNSAKIWNVNKDSLLRTFNSHPAIYSVDWNADGTLLAIAGENNSLSLASASIYNTSTGVLVQSLKGGTIPAIASIAWSPDGSTLATGNYSTSAMLWDLKTGKVIRALEGHTDDVVGVAWNPDGLKLATSSSDYTIKIWNVGIPPLQQDTSDATFSIVMPQPAAQDIDMGRVLVGSAKDSVVVGVIRNTGSYHFRVDSIGFSGNQAPEFRLVSGFPPFVVQPNDSARVEFSFMPIAVGARQAQLLIFTQGDSTLQQTIRGEGVQPQLAVVNSVIDFGKVLVGTNRDTLQAVTIRNVGSAPLSITNTKHAGPNDKDFSTLAGGGTFTLNPNETVRLDLRFMPSDVGRTTGRLQFDYNGVGSPAEVILFAEGFRPDSGRITLVAGTASAFPGEHTTIPITFELSPNSILSNVTGFDVTLRYNSTLLFPADNSMNVTSSGNDALLTFFAPYNPAGGELLRVPFIATLGDDTATVVKIEKALPRTSSGNVDIATRDGSFSLKGVCYAGGAARLYKPSGKAMLMAIHPNPAEDEAEIEYETSETGATSLKIFNALGMEVAVPASAEMEVGFHVAKVRTSEFGAGTYFVVMTTPTERYVARFEVVR